MISTHVTNHPLVGDWRFDVDGAALVQPGCTRRLEDRSARTLALLCRRRGEVVSKADILAEVWIGRTVSANSVAIVIADLRRALGEDARAPRLIETVGKRGYRLNAEPEKQDEPVAAVDRRRFQLAVWMMAGLATVALLVLVVEMRATHSSSTASALTLEPIHNETGEARYDPLAKALAALVEESMARMPGIALIAAGDQPARGADRGLQLRERLIIWNDTPTLSLSAIDSSDGKVEWSGMAVGQPDTIAAATIVKLADLHRHLRPRG